MSETINTKRQESVPEGMHIFVIVDVDVTMPDSGYPNWKFTMEVREGLPYDGQSMIYNVSHSPAARWKAEEFLDATKAPDNNQDVSMYDFIGQTVRGNVKEGEYQGKKRNQLDSLLPHPESKPIEIGKAAKPKAGFKPTLPNTDAAAPPAQTPPPPRATQLAPPAPKELDPNPQPTPPAQEPVAEEKKQERLF